MDVARYIYLATSMPRKPTADQDAPSWTDHVQRTLESQPKHVYSERELTEVLATQREDLRLPASMKISRFIETLISKNVLRKLLLTHDPPHTVGKQTRYPSIVRYASKKATAYDVGLSWRAGAYLSHGTALWLHRLSEVESTTIYVNKEQSAKPKPDYPLTQQSIELAFKNAARVTRYVFSAGGRSFAFLSGKQTNRAGIELSQAALVPVTSIERTLIDVVVRPSYAGGVRNVLAAYQAARNRMSITTLIQLLETMDHVYPYHQSIGFYMERAGFGTSELDTLRTRKMQFDFYLANRMKKVRFDPSWRVHYPNELDIVAD